MDEMVLARSLVLVSALIGAACSDLPGGEADSGGPDAGRPGYATAAVERGGQLYDNWWEVTGKAAPTGKHPLYPSSGAAKGSATWRCVECHGWDYRGKDGAYKSGSHHTGIAGIKGTARTPQQLFDLLDSGSHKMGSGLGAQDLWDLVKFVKTGVIDTTAHIDDATLKSKGVASRGKISYEGDCEVCHGADGRELDFANSPYLFRFLPALAVSDPYKTLHKVRFGQPDSIMANGAFAKFTGQEVDDIVAHVQSMQNKTLSGADLVRGGLLYDTWWKVTGGKAPGSTHPLYPAAGKVAGSDTWRCAECHGWDYRGKDGAYKSGSHYSGVKGIRQTSKTAKAMFDLLSTGTHKLGGAGLLADKDIWDLVLWIKGAARGIDARKLIDSNNKFIGTGSTGKTLYVSHCGSCHGLDGKKIAMGGGAYVGALAKADPQRALHKIVFGTPGDKMAGGKAGGLSLADMVNIGAYCQTLP